MRCCERNLVYRRLERRLPVGINPRRSGFGSYGWPKGSRRGLSSTVELLVALALLAVLVLICGQVLLATVRLRSDERKRAWALQEAANVMEALFIMPWEEFLPGKVETHPCSREAQSVLGPATVTQEIEGLQDGRRRLRVTVQWPGSPGESLGSVSLVAFRHPPAEGRDQRPTAPAGENGHEKLTKETTP